LVFLCGEFLGALASEKTGSGKAVKKATLGVANRDTSLAYPFSKDFHGVARIDWSDSVARRDTLNGPFVERAQKQFMKNNKINK